MPPRSRAGGSFPKRTEPLRSITNGPATPHPEGMGLDLRTRGVRPRRAGGSRASFAQLGRALSLFGVVSALGGCMVGPHFAKPKVAVAESWSGKSDARVAPQAAVDSQWWKSFNDPTLDRLVELAYRQNLPLQIAGLRIVEARAQLGVATGQQYPQVQAADRRGRGDRAQRERRHVAGPSRSQLPELPGRASTPRGSWTSGASTGAASRRRPAACSRRWPTTTRRSSR